MPNFARRWGAPSARHLLAALIILLFATLWQFDSRVGRLWLNSATLALAACLIALPFGTFLATAIFKTDLPGRRVAALLLIGILFVPLYLVTGAWDAGFGVQGWYTLSTDPHLTHQPWFSGWPATVWVHGLAAVPWVVLIVGTSLRTVEAEIEEDAATCTDPRNVLWHVSIPRAAPAIVLAGLWVAVVVATEISVTDFFQVRTFAEEVYTQAALGSFDQNDAPLQSAIGFWNGLLLSTMLALAAIVTAGRWFADLADVPQRSPWIWRLGFWRWPVAAVVWLGMFLLVGVPLGNLVYKAGVRVSVPAAGQAETANSIPHETHARVRTWSAAQLAERLVAAPEQIANDVWLSARIAAAAATAALLIALPFAWSMRASFARSPAERSGLRLPWLRLLAISLCLTIPGPLLGIAVIWLLNPPIGSPFGPIAELYDTLFSPWLVQTARALPLATLIVLPAVASVPQVMLDTAATDGCGWWGRLFRIAIPQRWPALIAAWLVGFAVAIGELAATILVMPPQQGQTAFSIRVFQALHYGMDDRLAANCLVMVFGVAAITGIAAALVKRRM
jgi:iron(III) transport system permease protein